MKVKIERNNSGDPEKYCKANFLGRGETNEANLKGLLANLFLLRNLFGRGGAGVPPSISHAVTASLGAKHRLHSSLAKRLHL